MTRKEARSCCELRLSSLMNYCLNSTFSRQSGRAMHDGVTSFLPQGILDAVDRSVRASPLSKTTACVLNSGFADVSFGSARLRRMSSPRACEAVKCKIDKPAALLAAEGGRLSNCSLSAQLCVSRITPPPRSPLPFPLLSLTPCLLYDLSPPFSTVPKTGCGVESSDGW